MSERLPAERPERDTGIRYPEEVKEHAYQLWAFVLGGNAEKVAAELAKLDPPVIVDGRTVRDWATRYQWAIRRADDWRRIAPDLSLQTVIETRYGLLEAARMARDTVTTDKTLTVESFSPNGTVTRRQVPAVSYKDRIAAGALLQKIEESLRSIAVGTTPPAIAEGEEDDANLTPEERLDRARQRMAARYQDHWQ